MTSPNQRNATTQKEKVEHREINPRYLVADPLMDGGAADVAGLLARADGVHGHPIRLQRLERDHDLTQHQFKNRFCFRIHQSRADFRSKHK